MSIEGFSADKVEKSNPSRTCEFLVFYDEFKERPSGLRAEVADLESDLHLSFALSIKCRSSEKYSQNLYAALCNNSFLKEGQEWGCSWRHAGGIIADLRGQGDYIDWYCSGIKTEHGFVEEGHVTEEVRVDLSSIGWSCI